MSDKKAKIKLKCAESLTDRTSFDKINDEYDLEQLVKHLYLCILQKNMKTYCMKCRKNTENLKSKIFKIKNGTLIMRSKCTKCGFKRSRFVKEQEAKGLLSNSGIKTLLSKISLLNVLF